MHPLFIILGLGAAALAFKAKKKPSSEGSHFGVVVNFPSAVSDEEEAADELVDAFAEAGVSVEEVLGILNNDGSRPQRSYLVGGYDTLGAIKVGSSLGGAKVTSVWTAPTKEALADKVRGVKLYKVLG